MIHVTFENTQVDDGFSLISGLHWKILAHLDPNFVGQNTRAVPQSHDPSTGRVGGIM